VCQSLRTASSKPLQNQSRAQVLTNKVVTEPKSQLALSDCSATELCCINLALPLGLPE